MVTLSRDAENQLEHYLTRVKAALRGHPSVDIGEVERDVVGHIDAELAGQPEPVTADSLRQVLDRLGTPDTWLPSEDLPSWRRVFNRLRSGPEEWRLAYLTFACFLLAPALFLGGPILWPLPPVLMIASFVFARASLSLLEEHGETVGARRWFLYPPLVLWYIAAVVVCIGWPLPPTLLGVTDTPVITDAVARLIPGPSWFTAACLSVLALGLWWVLFGLLVRRFTNVVRVSFRPFADRFERRHATRLIVAGAICALVSGGTILAAIAWRKTPAASAQSIVASPARPVDPVTAIVDAFRSHQIVALGAALTSPLCGRGLHEDAHGAHGSPWTTEGPGAVAAPVCPTPFSDLAVGSTP